MCAWHARTLRRTSDSIPSLTASASLLSLSSRTSDSASCAAFNTGERALGGGNPTAATLASARVGESRRVDTAASLAASRKDAVASMSPPVPTRAPPCGAPGGVREGKESARPKRLMRETRGRGTGRARDADFPRDFIRTSLHSSSARERVPRSARGVRRRGVREGGPRATAATAARRGRGIASR
eukprot:29565-Pelagococcus_subviridis.AAC.17